MTMFAIGLPGQTPRILFSGGNVEPQLQDGEVALPVEGPGEWLISADGQKASARFRIRSSGNGWIRRRRDMLLTECDWTQLPDVPETTRAAWVSYRQALRDLTDAASPADVVWPTMPGAGDPA
jgi:hypothetical protein